VSMIVFIEEGPRYRIDFAGNKHFWNMTLRKDLVIFTRGNRNDLGLKKSARRMKRRYREAGFLEAKVRFEDLPETGGGGEKRVVRFNIDEGPRSIVEAIRIEGNDALDEEAILEQMFTRLPDLLRKGAFVPETLDEDLIAIRSLYLRHGFKDVEIGREVTWGPDGSAVVVRLTFDEGPRTIVSSAAVIGTELLSEEEIAEALALDAGEPFRQYMVKGDENALSALISEKGYPHVDVMGEFLVSDDRSEAAVVYHVDEGPYVVMGKTYYSGNFKTREKILEKEFEIEPGDPFSLRKMLEGQRNIRDLDIFNSVQFRTIGLKEEAREISLFIEMEEEKPYFVQAGGGYETEKGFFAHARAGDGNLLGTNKDIWIGGEVSEIGYRGEAGFTEPRLFGTRILMNIGFFAEDEAEFNQDFGTRVYGTSVGFVRELLERFTIGLHVRYEWRDQYRRNRELLLTDEFDPRGIIVTTPSIGYDTRDSFIRPRKGILSSLSMEISNGLDNDLDDFIKYNADLRLYWTPLKRLTLAWLGRAGYIDPYGAADKVPDDQLFFLGGTSDVRGFDENMLRFDVDGEPLGGRVALAGSVEARIDLGLNFELTGFFDAGGVMSTFDEAGSESFRPSAGAGLRYITPIGPIGFLYGFKLDRKEDESPGRLHFSLGYTF
ncbi:outer membrane protein assembly factor BamA, partial [Thermodesulfobacteriota bacterium]